MLFSGRGVNAGGGRRGTLGPKYRMNKTYESSSPGSVSITFTHSLPNYKIMVTAF
jgi:hypothetical protein